MVRLKPMVETWHRDRWKLLAGTGGCTAFDVVEILKKGRHAITGCEVSLQAERAKTEPKVFTRIHFHFRIRESVITNIPVLDGLLYPTKAR